MYFTFLENKRILTYFMMGMEVLNNYGYYPARQRKAEAR